MKSKISSIVFSLVFVTLLSFAAVSCSQKKVISFDTSNPLAMTPGVEWAVVSVPYAAFRESPAYHSTVTAQARSGDIFMVKGKRFVKDSETKGSYYQTWFYFEKGWLEANSVKIYDTQLKAETASSESAR